MPDDLMFNGSAVRQGDESRVCLVTLDIFNRVRRASAVTCAWEGTDLFHDWFMSRWPSETFKDGGTRYYRALAKKVA